MRDWELTAESFELFLTWLDTDREQAAHQYEAIRRRLIVFFDCRGCADSEGLADETINRVIRQTPELRETFTGDPIHRLYGVAHYLHLEYLTKRVKTDGGAVPDAARELNAEEHAAEKELRSRCLDKCLLKLAPDERSLVIQYYRESKQAKIDHRKWLAQQWGLSASTLRTRMNRLRQQLRECITSCTGKN